jgi:prepilin-type N-terminal cleavage/methylation domain-containing protein
MTATTVTATATVTTNENLDAELAEWVRTEVVKHDDYTLGWKEADDAIKHDLPGAKDYSQGTSMWDLGWNSRIDDLRNDKGYTIIELLFTLAAFSMLGLIVMVMYVACHFIMKAW